MRIATWNVNSVRQRLDHLLEWLPRSGVDVACLQELKCVDEAFPRAEIEALGFNVETFGQKGFNGVALLSRHRLSDVMRGLPGEAEDEQARYLEALVEAPDGDVVRVASIYLPNGNPAPGPKYDYKFRWMARLKAHVAARLTYEEPLALAGDFNVIPAVEDVAKPDAWRTDALFLRPSRAALGELIALGLTDAVRGSTEGPGPYTFWDYQAGAFQKNDGIRIDHILLSPQAADRLMGAAVDREMRAKEKPSDHVPVRIDLAPRGAPTR